MTWNVRGLNDRRKARLVAAYVKCHKVDICMLQETHLVASSLGRMKAGWVGECHCSVYSSYARGVAILLRKGLQWRTRRVIVDPSGRYVMMSGTLLDRACWLVAVYGPNADDPEFFRELWHMVELLGSGAVLWGGDFNVVLDSRMDRKSAATVQHGAAARALVDLWRCRHGAAREGTCVNYTHSSWSRIDRWLGTRDVEGWTSSVDHLPCTLSDHSPVRLVLEVPSELGHAFLWRLPCGVLRDVTFRAEVREAIVSFFAENEGSVGAASTLWEAFKVVIRGVCLSKQHGMLRTLRRELADLEGRIQELERRLVESWSGEVLAELRVWCLCMRRPLSERFVSWAGTHACEYAAQAMG
ncbi:hypothetical protein NDU88_005755 [Pleurodeles waltl]|uniref:exodeoxyribonuclease III n=1 Tax=Pleurodeles waltl TaxID=8319 RepID=A0AAV7LY67_PLEWA|nr:hypothetical protein NDU88_005755 [Pleurodeles waltl]